MNPQAETLNQVIAANNPAIFEALSQKGKAIFFPNKGILGQSADAKSKTYNATIGIATEDDGQPMRLSTIAEKINLAPTEVFPYAPSYGISKLRNQWKDLIKQKNPSINSKITLPVIANGLTHALSIAGHLFINPGDQVIMPDKFWGNYKLIFEHTFGAEIKTFPTFQENKFNIDGLQKELLDSPIGKKILLLNFPNNPTGYTPTNEEAEAITSILLQAAEKGNSIVVLLDDAYFGLVYQEGTYTESLFSNLCNLHPNLLAIKIDGITKEDYAWGFRVAFITYGYPELTNEAANALEEKTAGAIRSNISNASLLSESLASHAFESPSYNDEKAKKYDILKSRFDEVQRILENPKYKEYFHPLPHNSGYFMCVELKSGLDAEAVRQTLLNKYDTGVIALENMIRVAYSSVPLSQLEIIFENIFQACQDQS